jgi:hypothetical protein
MKKSQERRQVNFRPTPNLRKRLDAAAKENGVALNAEIVRRLDKSFSDEGIDAIIENTALRMSIDLEKGIKKMFDDAMDGITEKIKTAMVAYIDARIAAERTISKERGNA